MSTLLSVNNYYYRRDGSEVVYFEHNRLFEQHGWRVIPFSMQHPMNRNSDWSGYFVEEIEFGHEYSVHEKLRRVPKIIYSREARSKMRRILSRVSPDICHCHTIYHHISPSILHELKKSGVKTVMTLHDLKIACPAYHMFNGNGICEACQKGRLHNVVRYKCIKESYALSGLLMIEAVLHRLLGSYKSCVDRFISPCQFYIDKLVEWGWSRNQFVHIPNPVDIDSYVPYYEAGDYALYFGRLSKEKGLVTLINAAAQAKVPLRFAGDGPQMAELKGVAAGLGSDVEFWGSLAGDDLCQAVQKSRVTVLPSEWYENAPMSVLESFAMGKPVICADIGGMPELLLHEKYGNYGEKFTHGATGELTQLLENFWAMSDSRISEMGMSARRMVESEMSSEVYIQKVSSLYEELGVQQPEVNV